MCDFEHSLVSAKRVNHRLNLAPKFRNKAIYLRYIDMVKTI